MFCGARGPWQRLTYSLSTSTLMGCCCTLNERGKSKSSSQMQPYSAVERTCQHRSLHPKDGVEATAMTGAGAAEQEPPSDVHPATWPVQVTMPPPQRVHSHWPQLTPWLRWTSRPCWAPWVLPACGPPGGSLGFSDSHLPATTRWLLWAWPSQTRSLIGLLLFTQDLSSRLCCFSATFLSRHF